MMEGFASIPECPLSRASRAGLSGLYRTSGVDPSTGHNALRGRPTADRAEISWLFPREGKNPYSIQPCSR